MYRTVFVLGLSLCLMALLAMTVQDSPEKKAPTSVHPWNLDGVDARFLPALEAIQAREFQEAKTCLKQLAKDVKKEKLGKEMSRHVKFLEGIVKDFLVIEKILGKRSVSSKGFARVRALTFKNRETFAYFHFLDLESELRAERFLTIADFEPPLENIKPMATPLELFERFEPKLTRRHFKDCTTDRDKVCQGWFAYHWKDDPSRRNLGQWFPSPTPDWSQKRYLCFSAKLSDPKGGRLVVIVYPDEIMDNYWKLMAGTWKGWKHFRMDLRKQAVMHRRDSRRPMSWTQVARVGFFVSGGLTDFYIDDIYLSD